LGYAHPLVSVFRNQEQAGLLTTPVQKHFKLNVPEASRAKVALALDDGDPFVVEEPIGRGRSIIVATSADASWTAMPLWPSYVPLVQELLLLATHDSAQGRNVLVAQPLLGPRQRGAPHAVHLTLPGGESGQVRVNREGGESQWTFQETLASGLYSADSESGATGGSLFAVNVNTIESDLAQVDPVELAADVWPGVSFYHHTNWRDLGDEPATEIVRHSDLHRWMLIGVLGLLLMETFLGWFFGRRGA
jgi:hypothetical protein